MKPKRFCNIARCIAGCGVMLAGPSQGALVLDQIGAVGAYVFGAPPTATLSQIFTDLGGPGFDCTVLENFTVSATELELTRVFVLFSPKGGFDTFQSVQSYDLNIFSAYTIAATTLSGDVASRMLTPASGVTLTKIMDGSDEYGLVSLDVTVALPAAGTYWLGVSPRSANSDGLFQVMHSGASGAATTGDQVAYLANPGQGLEVGAIVPTNFDYAYSVTAVPEPSAVTLCLLAGCGWLCRRQRPRQA